MKSKKLPKEILNNPDICSSGMAWRKEDIPEVLQAAMKANLTCVGDMPQYRGPSFTCEPYWLFYRPKPRKKDESWEDYSTRSNDETLEAFNFICFETNFSEEIIHFQGMEDIVKIDNFNPVDYLWFTLSFRDPPNE